MQFEQKPTLKINSLTNSINSNRGTQTHEEKDRDTFRMNVLGLT